MLKKPKKQNYKEVQKSPFNKGAGTRSVTGGSLKIQEQKAITLISLIITIILMLILASVTISIAVGGGLFDYAGKSVSDTEKAMNAVEQLANGKIKIAGKWYASMDDYVKGNELIFKYNEISKDQNGCVTENAQYESDGLVATIPAGFKVSEKTGETSIKEGLVIKDKDGNEFVWVPCTTKINDQSGVTLYAKDTKYNDGTEASKSYEYTNYSDWTDDSVNTTSVGKYGGFYVARYEAGIPSNATFYGTEGSAYNTARNVTTYVPVSKQNNPSWNYISQVNAKTVSEAMYANSKSVKSSLIDSYAWDTIVNWMESKEEGIALDSTDYGNYLNSTMSLTDVMYAEHTYDYTELKFTLASGYQKGNLEITSRSGNGEVPWYELATGTTAETKVLNIYDMAGNMWEWTTENGYHEVGISGKQYAVHRGGLFSNGNGFSYPVSYRYGNSASVSTGIYIGFRVVLYIK